jgi:hypothetical protein
VAHLARTGISVASRKDKGRRLQKKIGKLISNLTGLSFGPDEPIASREMGQSGTDVRLVGDARVLFPYSVECKNVESWSFPAWIKQAKENEEPYTDWALIVAKNHYDPIVVISLEHFMELQKAYMPRRRRALRDGKFGGRE